MNFANSQFFARLPLGAQEGTKQWTLLRTCWLVQRRGTQSAEPSLRVLSAEALFPTRTSCQSPAHLGQLDVISSQIVWAPNGNLAKKSKIRKIH